MWQMTFEGHHDTNVFDELRFDSSDDTSYLLYCP